jgi:hypothetical protein
MFILLFSLPPGRFEGVTNRKEISFANIVLVVMQESVQLVIGRSIMV